MAQATDKMRSGAGRQQDETIYMSSAMQRNERCHYAHKTRSRATPTKLLLPPKARTARPAKAVRRSTTHSEISKLAALIDNTDGEVQSLAQQSEQIGKVLEVIRAIADKPQTCWP